MKTALLFCLLAGGLASCTKHVYSHSETKVWQKRTSSSSGGSSAPARSSAPAASIQPYAEESVTAIQAE